MKLDDEISNTLPISTGIPQGSILGPLLFILDGLYINDMYMASDKFKTILYADDTTLVSTVIRSSTTQGASVSRSSTTQGAEVSRSSTTQRMVPK